MAKAQIYNKEKGYISDSDLILLRQLDDAVQNLHDKMRADRQIYKIDAKIGFGVDKAQRGIAADSVISIARAIKALKGW